LVWIDQLSRKSYVTSKLELKTQGLRLVKLLLITIFAEFTTFSIFASQYLNVTNILCLLLGLLAFAFNTWTYPILIKLRLSGSATMNGVTVAWNPSMLFLYVFLVNSEIDLVGMFLVGLVSNILLSSWLFTIYLNFPERNSVESFDQ
jgi:hypothetical protein